MGFLLKENESSPVTNFLSFKFQKGKQIVQWVKFDDTGNQFKNVSRPQKPNTEQHSMLEISNRRKPAYTFGTEEQRLSPDSRAEIASKTDLQISFGSWDGVRD